jgi:DNA-binding CsgD family transcriptional regulator
MKAARGGRIQNFFFIEHPPSEPLTASVFALHPNDPAAARLLLSLHDPCQRRAQNWQCFAERFGLTPAELRLCMALTEELCLADYSAQVHISTHTARSQLKRIFEKTGTHRQVQLLRLIFAFVHP